MIKRILLVEDEPVLCKNLARLLTREGYAVVTAGTRAEAVSTLSADRFDILLLDLKLPDGDGFELLAGLEERQRPARTVLMTAFSTPENEARAQLLNVVQLLRKPLDLCHLMEVVRG